MRAITTSPPAAGARLQEMPTPTAGAGEVLVRMLEAGVCGTDRDIVAGGYGTPPAGEKALILGHENLGRVADVGAAVTGWSRGDLVVATVRRGCGRCRFCLTNQSDFCETGGFTERGIRGAHGYFAEAYTEVPSYLVHVPEDLRSCAVLLEPLSVVEKAVTEGHHVLARRGATPGHPAPPGTRVLVAGTGAIGMLACFVLRAEGHRVTAIDRHGDDTPSAKILRTIGAQHVNTANGLAALGGERFELVLEATGSATLDLELLKMLGPNGVLVLTGIPEVSPSGVPLPGGILRDMVLKNQAVVGSVNANRRYFETGVVHLGRFRSLWGSAIDSLVTDRQPLESFESVLSGRASGTTKSVLVIGKD
jgi:threonine dehydrogenase-like Zn-dependent dehydrogenase